MLDFETTLAEVAERGQDLRALLTPKQLEIEQDLNYKRIVWGGRQWGKTTWTAIAHVLAAIPGATSLAIAPTVTKARDLLWPGAEWLNSECGAGLELRRGDFQIITPNGGTIQLMGMSTEREAEKIRGYTPPFMTLEECGTFKPELLQFAIESCATPAQIKWFRRGGRGIALIGTPGRHIKDYWHRCCSGELGGSAHFATVHDNPHIPDAEAYLEWVMREYNWTRATPRFRREYLGQFCAETDSMCYLPGWNQVVLPASAIPQEGYTIMGLDLGATRSPSAWVVFRITRELQGKEYKWITHAIHAEKHMTPTVHDVAAVTFRLRKQFGVARIRGDAAGQGAQTLDTLTTKFHGTPVEHAPKAGSKMARIWLMASMLQVDALRIYEGALPLADELLTVPWNEDRDDHHGSFPDHACDAGHYGIELVQQWVKEREPDAPAYGGPQWEKQQMERYKNEAIRRHLSEDN